MADENKNEQKESIESINAQIKELKKKRTDLAKNTQNESFSWQKLRKGMFSILNPVEWVKTLREIGILDVRKWLIYAIIIGGLYGYGYFKGVRNKPIHFNLEGKTATIALNEHYLKIERDGTAKVIDKEGNTLKTIKTGDIPELQRALKPIGLDIHPFFTSGYGVSIDGKSGAEAGIGTSIFKFYKVHIDTWLTNNGIYLGTDYKITDNFGIIGGAGKGFEGDNRAYIGGKWEF